MDRREYVTLVQFPGDRDAQVLSGSNLGLLPHVRSARALSKIRSDVTMYAGEMLDNGQLRSIVAYQAGVMRRVITDPVAGRTD